MSGEDMSIYCPITVHKKTFINQIMAFPVLVLKLIFCCQVHGNSIYS